MATLPTTEATAQAQSGAIAGHAVLMGACEANQLNSALVAALASRRAALLDESTASLDPYRECVNDERREGRTRPAVQSSPGRGRGVGRRGDDHLRRQTAEAGPGEIRRVLGLLRLDTALAICPLLDAALVADDGKPAWLTAQ
jgi:hypothetical protein